MSIIFKLEPYKPGGSNRYICPSCGKKKCFTRYINTDTGEYVDDTCGICDHEQSCGYHYPPKEFFRDHPTGNISKFDNKIFMRPKKVDEPVRNPLYTIDKQYVKKSHCPTSQFMTWLTQVIQNEEFVQKAFDLYQLGATRDGGVIFWQIDKAGRVRTGKIMHYTADGHRTQHFNFVHAIMKNQGLLPSDWTLTQCLFGEHLLATNSDKTVYLVESEKTAIICSIYYPQYLWLATSGCKGINEAKLAPLKNRIVKVIPDSGVYDKWKEVLAQTEGIKYSIVKDLENYPPNTDIADLILNVNNQKADSLIT